jgi:hypothetical protein
MHAETGDGSAVTTALRAFHDSGTRLQIRE